MVELALRKALYDRDVVYNAIINQSKDSISLIDAETGRFVEFNEAAWRNLGYSAAEFAQMFISDIESSHDAQQVAAQLAKLRQQGSAYFEGQHRCKDGALRDVQISVRLVQVAGKDYFASIWADISDRKRAEQRLRASEAALQEAQSIAQLGSWSLDIPKNRLTWSHETYRIFGIAEQTPLALSLFWDATHPDDRDRVRFAWNAALAGVPYDIEHRIVIDGETRWVRERARVHFTAAGEPMSAVGTVQDISEQRWIKMQLAQYQDHLEHLVQKRTAQLEKANHELVRARNAAEAANQAKTTFLTNMSHELRTPINAIIGLTHLLQREISNPRHCKTLRQVAEAAHHLMSVINGILELSRLQAGRLRLEAIDFALTAVIDNLLVALRDQAKTKGLTITQFIDPNLPHVLHGDPVRLRQVLLNFALNAVKFTEFGTISVRAMRVSDLGVDSEEVRVRFEIQDTGIGIDPSMQARLFQAFEQADSSTTRKYGGAGLGLALNQRLIDLMGGEYGVDSTPGIGSTFWFAVTLRHPAASAKPPIVTPADHYSPLEPITEPLLVAPIAIAQTARVSTISINQTENGDLALFEAVTQLQNLLAEDDLRASQIFTETADLLRAWFGDAVVQIERHIDAFEYDKALKILQALVASHECAIKNN